MNIERIKTEKNYETKHYPIAPPDPVDAIKFRMEQSGLTRKDLEPFLGSRGISEIFSKKGVYH